MVAMFGPVGSTELIIILVIVLVLFGSSRIPQLMGGFGEGLRNFKKSMRDGESDSQTSATNEKEAESKAKDAIDHKSKVL